MKMHKNKLKRFNVYGKIANVLFIIVVVSGTLLTLGGIIGTIYLNSTDFDLANAVNFIFDNQLPGAELILAESMEISYGVVYMIVLGMAISFALAAFVIKAVANMFKTTVEEQTPFTQKTVSCIKGIGAAFLIYAAVVFVLSIITGYVSPTPGFHMSINGRMILIGLLVMALGEMFAFGWDLQQDSESIL